MFIRQTPQNELELMKRATALAGLTLQELANVVSVPLPTSLMHAKGFIGQLIELHLGAAGDNKPQPDFEHLGIELKTLPFNSRIEPQETTYVCTAPLSLEAGSETWETSRLRRKLAKVLWVPIEADPSIPLKKRRVARPILFTLSPPLEMVIQQDWEELMELLHLGNVADLTSHHGQYLQVRPKAAHSRVLMEVLDQDGKKQRVGPKGFYLRTQFTKKILEAVF